MAEAQQRGREPSPEYVIRQPAGWSPAPTLHDTTEAMYGVLRNRYQTHVHP